MKRMWNNLLMDEATGTDGGGGVSGGGKPAGGATSFITTPDKGGQDPQKTAGADPTPGDGGKGNAGATDTAKGGQTSDWRSALPKELQEDATIKKFTSVDALAGAYINAQKLIGGDKIPVPNKHTTDKDWADIYKKLGLPEKVDDYNIKFKDGVPVEENFAKMFKQKAHAAGILPKQAQVLAEFFSDSIVQSQTHAEQMSQAEFTKNKQQLEKEWGNSFDLNVNRANKVVNELGGPELSELLNSTGAGGNAVIMKFLAKVGENLFKEHKFVEGEGTSSTLSPKELDAQINKLRAEPAYYDKAHPQHKAIVEEIKGLYDLRYPNKK